MAANTKRKCWAQALGDCAGKMSREHPISQSIFGDGPLVTGGFPRVAGALPGGIHSLAAKNLCERHNNQLSILDSEAKKRSDAILSLNAGNSGVLGSIDGELFTRWALKCFTGIVTAGWALEGRKPEPELPIIETIFGCTRAREGVGLYLISPSPGRPFLERFEFREFSIAAGSRRELLGAILHLHGCTFVLSIVAGQIAEFLARFPQLGDLSIAGRTLVYRTTEIGFRAGDRVGSVKILWPEDVNIDIHYVVAGNRAG